MAIVTVSASRIISIHAPTRGATQSNITRGLYKMHFNPRSHEGSDQIVISLLLLICDFNPRSHEGSDLLPSLASRIPDEISIHAPTRGATFCCGCCINCCGYFNPRSHEGSDSNFRQKVLFSLSKNCLKYLILTTNYFN